MPIEQIQGFFDVLRQDCKYPVRSKGTAKTKESLEYIALAAKQSKKKNITLKGAK